MSYNQLVKGRFSSENQIYHITTVTQGRVKYFSDFFTGRKVVNEIRRLHDDNLLQSLAFVLMPDHLHWLFQLGEKYNLSDVIRLFKGRSAKCVNEAYKRQGPVWQRSYYDHAIRKHEDIREIARYMVANPLRAGIVENIGEYSLWDAIWL